jgi:hypothetical protein
MNFTKLACFAVLALAPVASASAVTIGTPNGGNCFPFGCGGGTRYQQVWDSAAFAGPLTISSISFKLNSGSGPINNASFVLSLSTTASAVNGIDDVAFDSNVGGDDTVIFSGALAGQFDGTTLLFDGFSFGYDNSLGNLLLDVKVSGGGFGDYFFDAMNGNATQFSRAHDFGAGFDGYGLVATFNGGGGAVPEPASWAMLIAGFGLVGAVARRRRMIAA